MTDQASRVLVEVLDRLPVDVDQDLSSVRASAESRLDERTPTRQDVPGGRTPRGDSRPTRWRRIGVVVAALAIAVASTLYVVRAFNGPQPIDSKPALSLPAVEPHEVATIPVGPVGGVSAITSGFGGVWVAATGVHGGEGIDQDAILRLDPATNKVTDTVPVETVPTWETGGGGLATGFGSLWIAGSKPLGGGHDEGLLLRLDPESLSVVATISLPEYQGATDVAANDTSVWVFGTTGDASGITKVDPATNQVLAQTSLRAQTVRHVVATDSAVIAQELEWDHNQGPCSILASVDLTDAHLLAEQPGLGDCSGSGGPFVWEGEVWVSGADGFERVDPSTALAIPPATPFADENSFPRGDPAVGSSGVWFGAYPGGNGGAQDTLSRFDTLAGRIDTYSLKVGWSAATVLGDSIWAMNYDGSVTRIDLRPAPSSSPSEVSQPPVVGRSYLPPYLAGGNGWNSRSLGSIPAARQYATGAWASTIPISEDDVRLGAAIPPTTITELPPDGIVVTVGVEPSAFQDTSVPFPYADLSFDLTKATERGPQAEEPAGNYAVLQMNDDDAATLVRVYFGSPNPSPQLIAKAQAELDTLQLPPTCTVGGRGSYAVSASASDAQPGDTVTFSGSVPFQREDGSFDESGAGQMVAWWNVPPGDWEKLPLGSPSPSPAIQGGDIVPLGSAPMDECTFAIPFTVPEVAPGDYPVLVRQEAGGGASLEGSVVIHVTGG
jgi:hypothetical protein